MDIGIESAQVDDSPSSDFIFEKLDGNLPKKRWKSTGRIVEIKVIDNVTTLVTGDLQADFCVPATLDGAVLQEAQAWLTTASSSGLPTIQIRNVTQSVDMLSTKITVDANETTSYTAATPSVVDVTKNIFRKGDVISIDIDGAGTGAKGLGIILELQ